MSENILKEYVNEIYNQADILLENSEEKEFKEELERALVEKIGEASIDMLDEDSKEEYYVFLETKPTDEKIREFLISHIDNFDEKINNEIINFCSDFILKIKKSIIMGSVDVDKYSNEDESVEDVLINESKNN